MSCGGHRCSSDPELLGLRCSPVATAAIRPLAWEPLYAAGMALKRQKKTQKKHKEVNVSPGRILAQGGVQWGSPAFLHRHGAGGVGWGEREGLASSLFLQHTCTKRDKAPTSALLESSSALGSHTVSQQGCWGWKGLSHRSSS